MFSYNFHNVDEKNLSYETGISFQIQMIPSFRYLFTNLECTEWEKRERMNHRHKGAPIKASNRWLH